MSFEKKEHNECHHIQKCSFQPIVKSNPVNDLSYLVSKLTPSFASFYNVRTSAPLLPQIITSGEAVTFTDAGPKTNDITIAKNPTTVAAPNTITIKRDGVYEISYTLLIAAADIPVLFPLDFFAKVGLKVTNPNELAYYPVQSVQNYYLSITGQRGDSIFHCLPLAATFQLEIKANAQLQLVNLLSRPLYLCNGIDGLTDSVNAIINIKRLG